MVMGVNDKIRRTWSKKLHLRLGQREGRNEIQMGEQGWVAKAVGENWT